MRSARSQFAADFLACAGLAYTHSAIQRSAEQIADCDADLIVLCSSDAEYLPIAGEVNAGSERSLPPVPIVVIAGNPDTAEQLRNLGVADFIHLRSNAVEVLAGHPAADRNQGLEMRPDFSKIDYKQVHARIAPQCR